VVRGFFFDVWGGSFLGVVFEMCVGFCLEGWFQSVVLCGEC